MKEIKAIVVDDEKFGREQIKSLLKRYFQQVDLVAEAADAVEALRQIYFHKPDLVFLDIEMPDKGGFEMLENIQEHDFEIIFVTAYDQYALKAIKFSALDYLLKPVNKEEFKSAINKFLDKRKMPTTESLSLIILSEIIRHSQQIHSDLQLIQL